MKLPLWPFRCYLNPDGIIATPELLDAYNTNIERRIDEKLDQALRYHDRVRKARSKQRSNPRRSVDV